MPLILAGIAVAAACFAAAPLVPLVGVSLGVFQVGHKLVTGSWYQSKSAKRAEADWQRALKMRAVQHTPRRY